MKNSDPPGAPLELSLLRCLHRRIYAVATHLQIFQHIERLLGRIGADHAMLSPIVQTWSRSMVQRTSLSSSTLYKLDWAVAYSYAEAAPRLEGDSKIKRRCSSLFKPRSLNRKSSGRGREIWRIKVKHLVIGFDRIPFRLPSC